MKSQTAKNFSEFVDIVERLGNDSELMLFRGKQKKVIYCQV